MRRVEATFLAMAFVACNSVGILVVIAAAVVPRDTPRSSHGDMSLVFPLVLAFVAALVVLVAVASERWHLAVRAFVAQAFLAAICLVRAVQVSPHGDGKIVCFVLATELIGASAILRLGQDESRAG